MLIDFESLSGSEAYHWMSNLIVPRPIAWVSSISPEGVANLAPFSFFQGVTSQPPTLLIVPVNDRGGNPKDTVRNIETIPEFVVNLPDTSMHQLVELTSAPLPYGVSEFEIFGIESACSHGVRPPRVRFAPLAIECCLDRIITIGRGPFAGNVIFGRIRHVYVSDSLLDADGAFSSTAYAPLARFGSSYGSVAPLLENN